MYNFVPYLKIKSYFLSCGPACMFCNRLFSHYVHQRKFFLSACFYLILQKENESYCFGTTKILAQRDNRPNVCFNLTSDSRSLIRFILEMKMLHFYLSYCSQYYNYAIIKTQQERTIDFHLSLMLFRRTAHGP